MPQPAIFLIFACTYPQRHANKKKHTTGHRDAMPAPDTGGMRPQALAAHTADGRLAGERRPRQCRGTAETTGGEKSADQPRRRHVLPATYREGGRQGIPVAHHRQRHLARGGLLRAKAGQAAPARGILLRRQGIPRPGRCPAGIGLL